MLVLLLSALTAFAEGPAEPGPQDEPVCDTPFVFQGQPECVTLKWVDGVTKATNGCDALILVDASVQPGFAPVAPGQEVALRDLSAFPVGFEGELYRAMAVHNPACAESKVEEARVEPVETGATVRRAAVGKR
jgi:hypothetical protein